MMRKKGEERRRPDFASEKGGGEGRKKEGQYRRCDDF